MSKEGVNKADNKALLLKLVVFVVLYILVTLLICYGTYSNEICCVAFFFLIIFIHNAFYFWYEEKQEALKENSAFFSVLGACCFKFLSKMIKEKSMRILALPFIFGLIFISNEISFNDEQLYYWVFSTLAQVFGALLGLQVIAITTVIFSFEHNTPRKLKCLENMKNEAKYLLSPTGFVLIYSIMALSLSGFLITCGFCKVIIIIFGIEVPTLAIFSLFTLRDRFFECREEMMIPETE